MWRGWRHHFSDGDTAAPRQARTCLRSHSQRTTKDQKLGVGFFLFLFCLFYSQASCLSIHPGFPIYKMGTIPLPFLSLECEAGTAAHLFSYPELNLHQCPLLIYSLCGSWLLPVHRAASVLSRKEAGETSREIAPVLSCWGAGGPPSLLPFPSSSPVLILIGSFPDHPQRGPALTP